MNVMNVSGVSVQLYLNESQSPLEIGKCGYIGRLDGGDQVTVRFVIGDHPTHRILVVANILREAACQLHVYQNADGTYRAQHVVTVSSGVGSAVANADQNTNCIRLVEMDTKGLVQVTNIEVISQKGDFYFITRQSYRVQAYKGPAAVAVPALYGNTGFPELVRFITEYYGPRKDISLPLVSTYVKEELPDVSDLPDNNHLRILNWSTRKGVGAGLRRDGKLVKLYHGNVIVSPRTPVYLVEGEVVRVEAYRKPHRKPHHYQAYLEIEGVGIRRIEWEDQMAADIQESRV